MKKTAAFFKSFFAAHRHGIVSLFYALLNAALIYYCLELGNKNPFMNGIFYTAVNIITVFTVQAAFYLIFGRWWISSLCTSIPLTLLSIANYYTLMYRDMPISTQDLHNAGTSLSVIGSYSFPVNIYVSAIVVFFLLSLAVTWVLHGREKGGRICAKQRAARSVCLLLFCVLFVKAVYLGENPIKPKDTFVWSWEDSYYTYGYAASSVEVLQKSVRMIDKPEGYSADAAAQTAAEVKPQTAAVTPDVILVLNETFFDLRDIADFETDTDIMPFIDSLPESSKGRAVVAGTGGGTNKSEYELLTGNSLYLMQGITPFNYLNFDNASSVVSVLRGAGYSSWAAHCAQSTNYARGIVYSKLGFDSVLFADDFGKAEKYGKRSYATDMFCYERMIADYEKMGDSPRLMYMLTIQNHGGWELNDESEDLVHASGDFGEYADDVNEFLSCIKLSDEAFRRLTEYFADVDRPVVVCMVGDHSPAFAAELIDKGSMDDVMRVRSTPYVVWANYDIEQAGGRTLSMPYIVPNLLKAAGAPMSGFYEYMMDMCADVPVVTAFNIYETADGKRHEYSERTEFSKKIDDYFKLVYNNVGDTAGKLDGFFDIEK